MKILVSACLMGRNCKYNGGNNFNERVAAFVQGREVIQVCPEELAGLGVPRNPVEIVNGVVMDREGNSVDEVLRAAVKKAVAELEIEEIDCAILQSRSPTCGVNQIYDGTFSGTRISGSGIFAQALKEAGVKVIDVEDLS